MNIHELDSYNLGDAVKFHRRLNPRIWGRDEHLLPEVREKLLAIAADFQEFWVLKISTSETSPYQAQTQPTLIQKTQTLTCI